MITSAVNALDVSGQIDLGLNESGIGNDEGTKISRPNDWFADYSGTFVANGQAYTLDGEIDGQPHDGDHTVLPFAVVVEWQGVNGPRTLRLYCTVVAP